MFLIIAMEKGEVIKIDKPPINSNITRKSVWCWDNP